MPKRLNGIREHSADSEVRYFPDALKALLKAVREYFPEEVGKQKKPRSRKRFVEKTAFFGIYVDVCKQYGYEGIERAEIVAKTISHLESDSKKDGGTDINFARLRAYADFIGIPVGLFLIYSQLVSLERHDLNNRNELRDQLGKLKRAIEALQTYLDTEKPPCFHVPVKGFSDRYEARLGGLRVATEAFNDGKATPSVPAKKVRPV